MSASTSRHVGKDTSGYLSLLVIALWLILFDSMNSKVQASDVLRGFSKGSKSATTKDRESNSIFSFFTKTKEAGHSLHFDEQGYPTMSAMPISTRQRKLVSVVPAEYTDNEAIHDQRDFFSDDNENAGVLQSSQSYRELQAEGSCRAENVTCDCVCLDESMGLGDFNVTPFIDQLGISDQMLEDNGIETEEDIEAWLYENTDLTDNIALDIEYVDTCAYGFACDCDSGLLFSMSTYEWELSKEPEDPMNVVGEGIRRRLPIKVVVVVAIVRIIIRIVTILLRNRRPRPPQNTTINVRKLVSLYSPH